MAKFFEPIAKKLDIATNALRFYRRCQQPLHGFLDQAMPPFAHLEWLRRTTT